MTQIELLTADILASPKYRAVSQDVVRSVVARELAAHRSPKDAAKAARSKLHQIAGAYLEGRPDYATWLAELRAAAQGSEIPGSSSELARVCERLMARHASTRERLPILSRFYQSVLEGYAPFGSVLDLACGFGPLAIPWMPLRPGATYTACDLYTDLASFLAAFFPLVGVDGRAEARDLLAGPPPVRAEVAFALKLLPVLEQREKGAAMALLRAVDAPLIVVSFPTASLGGRGKAMAANYAAWFEPLVTGEGWAASRRDFPGELVYLLQK